MKKILVTGSNGFVGKHLMRELSEAGRQAVGVDSGHHGGKPEGPAEHYTIDLMDESAVDSLDFNDFGGVIHLAGMAVVGESFDQPLKFINVNAGIQINLFEAAIKQKAKPKFLIISSGTLYDPKSETPFTESSPLHSSTPYSVSKLTQEELAKYYESRGFETIIVRPFNHIGPGQNLGFLLPDLAKQVVDVETGKAKEIKVGNLDAVRDYTDVRDIVRAYDLLLDKGRSGETYNICSESKRSGHEILEALLSFSKSSPKVVVDPARVRPSDNPVLFGNCQKLKKDTGWAPKIKFEDTILDVLNDWRARATT